MGQWDEIIMRGDARLAAAFSHLFCPTFIEVDDCVLLAERYAHYNFHEWQRELSGNRQAIEAMINHLHIYALFLNTPRPVDLSDAEQFAQTLMKCWSCALKEAFPDKQFAFRFATEPDDYGPTVTFFQCTRRS